MILKKHILLFSIFIITSSSGQFALPSFQANQSKDNVSPTVVITAAGDDGNSVSSGSTTNDDYITFTMTFSEPVSGFAIGDITSSNGGLTSFSGSGSIYTVRFTPYSNSTGSIVISSGLCIDRSDNSNAGSNTFTIINDSAVPYFYSILNVASDNSTVSTTFNEAVYSTPNGSGSLEVSDFAFTISGGNATLVSATPSSISVSGNTYTLGINLSGMADGTEDMTLNPVDNGIYDIAGNEADSDQSLLSVLYLEDKFPAFITSRTLASNNSTLVVVFNEAVYSDLFGNYLEVSDFAFTISGGTATLASATPSSISSSGNTYTLGINLSGTSDGTETLTLNPVDDGVYDTDGNESTTSQSNNSVTLNDITPASITGITLAADNSTVSVTFSEAVYNATGGSGALEVSDFAFTISGGTATLASATPSSISSSGNTYTLGINLSGTADGNEVLKVNPNNASSIYEGNNNASYSTQSNNTVSLNVIVTNYVLNLNGSNEAAYVGDNSAFESTDYSIQLWVDPASLPSSGNQEWFVNKNKVYRIGLNNNSGTTKIIAEHRSGGSYERLEGTTLSNANGGWYHVVFTFDDGDNDLKLYVNGSLVADNNNYSGSTGNQSSSFSIGRRHDNSTGYLDGKIDEVAYWDEELSASAITALYNSGNTLSASTNSGSYQSSGDLVIYYEFQQNLNDSEGSFNLSNTGINSSNYGLETIQ